jgi:archaemetzincin
MMRRDQNGIIVLRIERVSSKMALSILLLVLSIFLTNHSIAKERNPTMDILLIPVGEVDRKVIEVLQNELSKVFNKPVMIGKGIPEPDDAFSKKRNQYLSTAILNTIMEQKEYASYGKILGIVDHDLYVPELNFVFGEAGRRAAVISLTRLRQEFYNLPRDQGLFHKRVLTEAVHELGHTHGLGHCKNLRCVMFFSNSLVDTDRKGPEFCPDCKKQLESRK